MSSEEKTNSNVQKSTTVPAKAWMIVLALFITGIAMAFAQNKVMPIIGLVQTDLSVGAGVAGWISSIFTLMGIVLAFPAVGLVRKWGIFKSGFISIIFTLVGSVIGYFAPEQYTLLISRIIEGFGLGLISIVAPSCINMWFPPEKRGLPMGIWSSWQMVAIASGFLFTSYIIGPDSQWKNMWILGIVLLVIAMLLYAAFVRPAPAEFNHADVEDTSAKVTEVFKHKSIYIMAIGGLGFGMAIMTFATWVATFWQAQAGMTAAEANGIVGYVYLAEIFTAILGGWILTKVKNRKRLVMIDGILYGFVFFAAFHITSSAGIAIVCALYCFLEGIFAAAMWTLVSQTIPDQRLAGAATAFYSMALNLGQLLGAPLAGMILDATHMEGWAYVAVFATICQVVGGICFGAMKLYNEQGEEVESIRKKTA